MTDDDEIENYIQREVDKAPALSPEQRAKLATLFRSRSAGPDGAVTTADVREAIDHD